VYIYSSPLSDRTQRLSKKGSLASICWLPQFDSVEPIEWPQLPTSRSRVLLLSTNPEFHAECLTAICFLKLLKRTALFPRLPQRLDPRGLSNAHGDFLMYCRTIFLGLSLPSDMPLMPRLLRQRAKIIL
jgi:hypothetical protein